MSPGRAFEIGAIQAARGDIQCPFKWRYGAPWEPQGASVALAQAWHKGHAEVVRNIGQAAFDAARLARGLPL